MNLSTNTNTTTTSLNCYREQIQIIVSMNFELLTSVLLLWFFFMSIFLFRLTNFIIWFLLYHHHRHIFFHRYRMFNIIKRPFIYWHSHHHHHHHHSHSIEFDSKQFFFLSTEISLSHTHIFSMAIFHYCWTIFIHFHSFKHHYSDVIKNSKLSNICPKFSHPLVIKLSDKKNKFFFYCYERI